MRKVTCIATAALTLLATIALAQTITYDFDNRANFRKFKTYAWVRGTEVNDELNHRRIVEAIDEQLITKGLAKVATTAKPDVLVAYHASFDRNLRINGFSSGWGGYRFAGSRIGTATAEEFLVGTLAVDIVDAETQTIVWRGMATKEIDVKANAAKRDKNISRAAEKLFKNYPPAR